RCRAVAAAGSGLRRPSRPRVPLTARPRWPRRRGHRVLNALRTRSLAMQRRRFNARLAAAGAAALAPLAVGRAQAQSGPVEGRHYIRLATPAPVSLPGPDKKVEVLEFFWYECPHCNSFEPLADAWSKRLSSDVVYRKVPVGFSARHQVAQKAFYALEEMGQL